jgi:hypothetical protein
LLSDDDRELYDKCTTFINNCVAIFGNLSIIDKCKNGDKTYNVSAAEFRYQLAKENGWHENLDVTCEFQKRIDEVYNPNELFEKASTFYNITRQRRNLITDNESKLESILEICKKHKDDNIIIVSSRGEFANKITEYINKNLGNICGDYHNCIEDCIATDALGEVILIKSGVNKGKPKIVGHQAISTRNETFYNNGLLNVLSIKSSSDKKLKVKCSIIVFTTPICDNIFEFRTRFSNIEITSEPIITYKLYCANTIEENLINKQQPHKLIKIINNNDKFIEYDENSGNIIL